MKQNPERYRYYETEHMRDTIDSLNIRRWHPSDGTVFFNRTYNDAEEQFYYSPSHFSRDTVGFRGRDNPFFVSHEFAVPPMISYTAEHTYPDDPDFFDARMKVKRTFEGWGPTSHCLHQSEPTESDEEFMTRAIAGLNPSRANASGAVFMAELRELPSLFKNIGEQIVEQGFVRGNSGVHLGIQFGWAPVIRDLKKFLTITDKVRRRMLELQELRGTGRLRREFREKDGRGTQIRHETLRLNSEHVIGVLPSYGMDSIKYDVHTEMRTTRYAIVEFLNAASETLFSVSDSKYWDEAHSLVYGTNLDGPSIWQAMPWSWLIDWTSNASEYIKSQNNVAGHKLGQTMLMKETQRISTITPVLDEDPGFNGQWSWTFLPGRLETTTKERILDVQPTVSYNLEFEPILGSEFKASILSALAIQKLGPKIRLPRI